MTKSGAPATVLIVAALPPVDRGAAARRNSGGPGSGDVPVTSGVAATAGVPVTWIADIDTVARGGFAPERSDIALDIAAEWFASRQTLRSAIARARAAVPGIESAVLRGAPLQHRELLAEAGIRSVLVDAFDDVDRGSRRPAPQGWPCRSVAWGLWEVESAARRATGLRAWLPTITSLPAARPGSFHVLVDRTIVPGGRPVASPRVERWVEWARARAARGGVMAVALADLPAVVERRHRQPLGGSVLKAA